MPPFSSMQNDTVYLERPDGNRSGPFKTKVGSTGGFSATIFERDLEVEEGWKLVRPLPSGKEEAYTILEANYSQGLHSIPPHWRLKLQKDTSLAARQSAPTTTINITNSQGIQVGDHNLQHITNSLVGLLEKIESSGVSKEEKAAAKGLIRQLLSNPTVAAVLGGAASAAMGMLQ